MLRTLALVCLSILVVCCIVQSQSQSSSIRSRDSEASFARMHEKIDVERIGELTPNSVAGRYSSAPEELTKKVVPLSGSDLYLFPDGSYFYYFWSDVPPPTIQDKGRWVLSGGELKLTSDPDVSWKPGAERRYLLVRRRSHPQEILAVGMDDDLPYFEQNAKDNPELMLLMVSKTRITGISPKESAGLKDKLMREGWRPDFYAPQKAR